MTIEINLMSQEWAQYVAYPGLKGQLRSTLWESGWRDGVEVTRGLVTPNVIRYSFDTTTNKV